MPTSRRSSPSARKRITVGDPLDEKTIVGPMISQAHLAKVRSYIELGPKEGATLLCGGLDAPELPEPREARATTCVPTVFADVDNRMQIAQDEIFGPVACLIPFNDEADAIRIANDIRLRPVELRVDREPRPRAPRGGRDRGRHVLRQQPERARPAPALRRHQGHRAPAAKAAPGATRCSCEPKNVARVARRAPHSALGSHDAWASSRSPPRSRTCRRCTCRELDGPHKGCRQAAIDGHVEIGRRCRELGVDTIVVFDVHWLVNANYHINCAPHFEGIYTSNELPHFIRNMPYAYPGNPAARPADRRGRQRARA